MEGGPYLSSRRTGHSLSYLPPYPHYLQVIVEAPPRHTAVGINLHMDIQANLTGLDSSLQSGPIRGIDEGGGTTNPDSFLPRVCSLSQSARIPLSDVMIRKSTLPGPANIREAPGP
jgi:hypothetical protein